MMKNEMRIQDKLAARIAQRRAAAEMAKAGQQEVIAQGLAQAVETATYAKIMQASQAIAENQNPMEVARLLGAIVSMGVRNKELVEALGKSKSWVSKRLGLLKAPEDIQRLIEEGSLTESEYYDHRKRVPTRIKRSKSGLQYQHIRTVRISTESARLLVLMLRDLAEKCGAAPIQVPVAGDRGGLKNILNARTAELLRGLKA